MKKLLHERLREWTKDDCYASVSIIALKDACNEAAIDAFTMFADEIERFYIPRPRFEDGEPVCTGTRAMTRAGQEGIVVRLECNYGNEVFDTIVKRENGEEDRADVIVKRPQPKVLHKEPDSLEKLQQFAVDSAAYAEGCEQDKFLEIANRLSALIERGA